MDYIYIPSGTCADIFYWLDLRATLGRPLPEVIYVPKQDYRRLQEELKGEIARRGMKFGLLDSDKEWLQDYMNGRAKVALRYYDDSILFDAWED